MRVGGQHLPDQRRRVGMELQVMLDGAVEQRRGVRAVGRQRQTTFVTLHQDPPKGDASMRIPPPR